MSKRSSVSYDSETKILTYKERQDEVREQFDKFCKTTDFHGILDTYLDKKIVESTFLTKISNELFKERRKKHKVD